MNLWKNKLPSENHASSRGIRAVGRDCVKTDANLERDASESARAVQLRDGDDALVRDAECFGLPGGVVRK